MAENEKIVEEMTGLMYTLRQKCLAKDLYFGKSLGISSAEFNCLVQFFDTDAISVKHLTRKLEITPGGVTRIITSLEKKGLIVREIDLSDRRVINIRLSEKGKKIVGKIRRASLEIYGDILHKIATDDQEAVVNTIQKLIDAIDTWLSMRRAEMSV